MTYDPNGNILTYHRNGNNTWEGKPSAMDKLTYHYNAGTEKLNWVHDSVPAGNYDVDIDEQEAENYTYDAIGNLISDSKDSLLSIEWTVYGKIKRITKANGTVIDYTYDASGNRLSKQVNDVETRYIRDATGNVMSIYVSGDAGLNGGDLTQREVHLYGSSRLGIMDVDLNVENPGLVSAYNLGNLGTGLGVNFTRGKKFFELGNHLGNVMATVRDGKEAVSDDGSLVDYYVAKIVSAQDYYPFGMLMAGRSFDVGGYRYGFNGKENDNEVKGEGNQQDYGMRVYDPRLGRFLSEDPLTMGYPMLTPYQFASNSPISGIDLDGREYLNFNVALVEFKEGALQLKLENMHNVTQNVIIAYVRDPRNWPVDENGFKSQGISLAVGSITIKRENPAERIGNGVNIDNGHSYAVSPTSNNPVKVEKGIAASTGQYDRRLKDREISTTAPRPSVGRTLIVVNAINLALENIGGYLINKDINGANDQARKYLKMVGEDMNEALKKGLIDPDYQNHESLINIANVVLQGVNNTKDPMIYNIGMNIYKEVSSKRFPQIETIKSSLDNIPSRQIEIPRIDESKIKKE